MQVNIKGGKPTVTLTKREEKILADGLGIVRELARYPETYKTAASAVQALSPIVGEPETK